MIELIVMLVLILIALELLRHIFKVRFKDIKKLGNNTELDASTEKLPDNIAICKDILKLINNESVKVKESENEKSGTSVYVAVTNTIIIAKIRNSYTRVQTIAHECIHSIQDRTLLMFNFVLSNIYLIYFIVICILTLLKGAIMRPYMQIFILLLLGFIQFAVRSVLEIDAMLRAKYLAKQYLESTNLYSPEEIEKIMIAYDNLNNVGIKDTQYFLLFNALAKVSLYIAIVMVLQITL